MISSNEWRNEWVATDFRLVRNCIYPWRKRFQMISCLCRCPNVQHKWVCNRVCTPCCRPACLSMWHQEPQMWCWSTAKLLYKTRKQKPRINANLYLLSDFKWHWNNKLIRLLKSRPRYLMSMTHTTETMIFIRMKLNKNLIKYVVVPVEPIQLFKQLKLTSYCAFQLGFFFRFCAFIYRHPLHNCSESISMGGQNADGRRYVWAKCA